MSESEVQLAKQQLLREFKQFVAGLLEATPVVSVAGLEERVRVRFKKRIAAAGLDRPTRSGRLAWANLVDWVKADLTEKGDTRYLCVCGVEYVAYLVPCGQVNGVGLVARADAARLRDALIALAEGR